MSIFMRKIPKAAIALLCLLAVFTWFTLSPMTEAQAVAVVDDVVIMSIIALLSGWGISFTAADATKADLTDSMSDLLDNAGVVLDGITTGAAVVASPGILKLMPAVVNAARKVALYLKEQVGGNTGTDAIVTPSGSPAVVDMNDFGKWTGTLGFNASTLAADYDFLAGFRLGSFALGTSAYYELGGKPYTVEITGVTHNASKHQTTYSIRTDYNGHTSTNSATIADGSVIYGSAAATYTQGITTYLRWGPYFYNVENGKYTFFPIVQWAASNATITETPAVGMSFSAVLDDASVPDADIETPVYVTAPGFTYDTTQAMADSWYDHVTADPEDRTYPVTQAVPNIIDAAAIQSGTGTAEDIDPDLDPVIGLVDVFPFCIPFDIYNFLRLFNHTREAPSVTIPLAFPEYIGGTQEIEIDLSSWEPVARILRTVELIAFIVGLAFETRKFIKW